MQDLNDLYYFVQVVKYGGFAPAGRAIGEPKSKLSRRVAQLEKRLGTQLLYRSTRNSSLTELGKAYYERCIAMLVEAEAAQDVIDYASAEPRGRIRISCPLAMLHFAVADLLAEFMALHPNITVELLATGRRVDVINEGIDLALRVRFPPLEDSDLKQRVLSESPQRLMAAPALLDKFGQPKHPQDLYQLPSLDWHQSDGRHAWHLDGPDGTSIRMDHTPRLVTDDLTTLYRAALAGLGVVQLPLLVARQAIKSGRLVELLPDWTPRTGVVYVVFPSRRALLPSIRLLIDFLAERFTKQDFEMRDAAKD